MESANGEEPKPAIEGSNVEEPKLTEEQQFHRDLLKALAPPRRRNRFLAIINASAFLWFMSVVFLGTGATYLDDRRRCVAAAANADDVFTGAPYEMAYRHDLLKMALTDATKITEVAEALKQFTFDGATFRGKSLFEIYRAYIDVVESAGGGDALDALVEQMNPNYDDFVQYAPLFMGRLPVDMSDSDLPAIKDYMEEAKKGDEVFEQFSVQMTVVPKCSPFDLLSNHFRATQLSNFGLKRRVIEETTNVEGPTPVEDPTPSGQTQHAQ